MIAECLYPDDTIIQDLFSMEYAKLLNLLKQNSKWYSTVPLFILFPLHFSFHHAPDSVVIWENYSVLTDPVSLLLLYRNQRDQ